jgi:hypothetical protein
MKKLYIIFLVALFSVNMSAQFPQKISYQAVIRNNSNALVSASPVGIRISILKGSASGPAMYIETQASATNDNGLVSLEIGGGIPLTGTLDAIDWSSGLYFIKTETDPTGGTNYTISGTSQLLSVPYSLYSKTAESISGTITETDPIFATSPANGITSPSIANWNTAYGWGTHTGLYRPVSYVPAWSEITNNPIIFTTPATDQLLKYNGTNWVNFTPDFALSSHTHLDATTSISGFMNGTDKTKLDGLQNADGSETKVSAGSNVTVTGSGTTGSPYLINSAPAHYIGELNGGGVVFYVDRTGQHGLICSMIDLSTSQAWSNVGTLIGATAQSDWNGQGNTNAIIGQIGHTGGAANLCDTYTNSDYGTGIFSDWYLFSIHQLNLLWEALYEVDKTLDSDLNSATTTIGKAPYWSSTEDVTGNPWYLNFYTGNYDNGAGNPGTSGKGTLISVRAIRAF